ncbi:helix-turn-helix transcriptional regulator [Lactiplantibacillus sp. WILCCON 0030]|uniref:Helix-turn-helix transcriptional regulator n=1 Tax=Lactiplantibacillus brownii TaxID=3069269 RepID=A0ABU1AAJ3_9LACO|nr:helix-turn-helix transcriptional regulator [Lactiplantibacillus brownii]MDQ7937931.1 helix-turn-helix transcriptional regulator [Lactiplantibacillus brownii]
MIQSDVNTLKNVDRWLKDHQRSHQFLATYLGITPAYMSQLFNQKRSLQPALIEKLVVLTGVSATKLARDSSKATQPAYLLRGRISNKAGQDALLQLLMDADRYVNLVTEQESLNETNG